MFGIKRKSRFENRYHPNMGKLITRVTKIQKTLFGISYKTLHEYRETYNGDIKECDDCVLSKIK